MAPFINPKGAIHDTERVPSTTPKGAICDIERVPSDARKGAIAMSPEPIEPSIEPSVEPNPLPPYRSKGLVRRNTYPPEFEEFWSEYPVGNGIKKKAAEQWSKLDPDVDLFLEIMAGLARWKACDRWQEGYVKYAETWLKDRWWENMPPPSKPRSMNGSSPAERTAANFDRVLQRMKQQQSGPDVIDIHGEVRS